MTNLFLYQNKQGNGLVFNDEFHFILKSDTKLMNYKVPLQADNELLDFVLRNTQDVLQAAFVLSKIWTYWVVEIPAILYSNITEEQKSIFCDNFSKIKQFAEQVYQIHRKCELEQLSLDPKDLLQENISLDAVKFFPVELISTSLLFKYLEPISGCLISKFRGTLKRNLISCIYRNEKVFFSIDNFSVILTESTITIYDGIIYERHNVDMSINDLLFSYQE